MRLNELEHEIEDVGSILSRQIEHMLSVRRPQSPCDEVICVLDWFTCFGWGIWDKISPHRNELDAKAVCYVF
jgi:hypothetical protein